MIRRQECRECGTFTVPLRAFEAHEIDTRRPVVLRLCERCVRERGAAWRWRWRIVGRDLPDARKAA